MNDTTVALAFLLAVLIIAAFASRRVAVIASLLAFACFNFFFLHPVGTFTIANKEDLVALFALLAVSLIGSHLSYQARRRAQEALVLAEQRNQAEMARRSAETKSALVASLSHDLKTPLTALTVVAGSLRGEVLSEEERRDQLEILNGEIERLRRLFEKIVDLASVESRTISAEQEWVMPADIIEAARRQAHLAGDARDVHIAGANDNVLVLVDPRLTSAALAHVLENAATYSPVSSPIDVDVTAADDRLVIAVRDRGPGIPPQDLERIFERFYRGDGHGRFGSGMGLAITRGLLAIQHGVVTAANHPDGGAVFTLQVPVRTRAANPALDVA